MPSPELFMSVAAVGISAWSVVQSRRTTAKQVLLQERTLSLENARDRERRREGAQAVLSADVIATAQNGRRLRIANQGPGHARNLEIFVDHQPISESELIFDGDQAVGVLGPGGHSHHHVRTYIGSQAKMHLLLKWVDDSGEEQRWESELKIH